MNNKNESILLVERKNNIVYLILNRQSVLNSLNKKLLSELKRELEKVRHNNEIQAIVISGAGNKAFSAGADIQYLAQASPLQVRQLANLAVAVNSLIENLGKISIALINGFALGGGLELAESCMFRIAVNSAKLGHPEVKIGAVAGWGGTTRLPRLIGKSRAAEMLLTGKMIDANEAVRIGLINRIVEQKSLQKGCDKFLQEILKNSTVATNLSWNAIHRGLNMTSEESANLGADYFGLIATTEEFRNGTKKFLSKK